MLFRSDNAIINVFIAGVGLVGSDLIRLIQDNNSINICGIINSRKMILNPSGLDSQHYVEELANGDASANSRVLRLRRVSMALSITGLLLTLAIMAMGSMLSSTAFSLDLL